MTIPAAHNQLGAYPVLAALLLLLFFYSGKVFYYVSVDQVKFISLYIDVLAYMFLTGFYTNSSRIYTSQRSCCDSFILRKIDMYTYTMTAILNFKIYRNFLGKNQKDFSGDPVVRTWCFCFREPSFAPWLGN